MGPAARREPATSSFHVLAGIRAVVYQRATPLATRSLLIEGSRLDERAGVVGALSLIRDHVLSAEGLPALLGSPGTPVV